MLKQKDIDILSPLYPNVDWEKTAWSYSRTGLDSELPDDLTDRVSIALQHMEGGCIFELGFEWECMDGVSVPRLLCFNDALPALLTPTLADVLQKLCAWKETEFSAETLIRILKDSGFLDRTQDTEAERRRQV